MAQRAPHITRRIGMAFGGLVAAGALLLAAPAFAADSTPPDANFMDWSESSPYAYASPASTPQRLWFNPRFSGTATMRINASDAESGIAQVNWPAPPAGWNPGAGTSSTSAGTTGLVGRYWDNIQSGTYPGTNFTGTSISRAETSGVNFSWGAGYPDPTVGADDSFSARWTGRVTLPETGTYYFQIRSDDAMKVFVDGVEVVSYWGDSSGAVTRTQCSGGLTRSAGSYDLRVEYYENASSTALAQLRWRLPSQAASYQAPSGTCTVVAGLQSFTTSLTGSGVADYPTIPASAFSSSGIHSRALSWSAGADGGTIDVTATNGEGLTSANVPVTLDPDSTPPTVPPLRYFQIYGIGWYNNTNDTTVKYPDASEFSDAGASAPGLGSMTREIQRREGTPDGTGRCITLDGPWSLAVTNPTGMSWTNSGVQMTGPGACAEFRYIIRDAVGNELEMYASGFRGNDAYDPTVSVTGVTEGTSPQYQHAVGSNIYVNPVYSGDFTMHVQPFDLHSGVGSITYGPSGTGWYTANPDFIRKPGPWDRTYSWSVGAASLGARQITVKDNVGRTAIVDAYALITDSSAPTAPGSATLGYESPTWRNTTSIPIALSTAMLDAGAGVATYQVQRDEAAMTGSSCGTFPGSWVDVGGVFNAPTLPAFTDTGLTHGTCYRYRVVATDNVANVGIFAPTASVRIDTILPSGTINSTPATVSGVTSLAGTATDDLSGPSTVVVRLENTASPGVTTTLYTGSASTGTWGPFTWDTTSQHGYYRLHLDVIDVAGNRINDVVVRDIRINNSIPTITWIGFTQVTNPDYQWIDPITSNRRIWVRTLAPASGSFTVEVGADDPDTPIDYVNFSGGPSGWTPSSTVAVQDPGPYRRAYTWTSGATQLGTASATAVNTGGRSSSALSFTVTSDNTAPTGGSITHATGYVASTSLTVTVTGQYTESGSGSGLREQRLERDQAAPVAGSCSGVTWPGSWTTVSGPAQVLASPITVTGLAQGTCYRLRLRGIDNVSNEATTTPLAAVASDTSAPTATIDATPTSPMSGTKTIAGTATDAPASLRAGMGSVTLRWQRLDGPGTGTVATTSSFTSGRWSIPWNTVAAGLVDGSYRLIIDAEDAVGNAATSVATRDVIVDNTAPGITFTGFVAGTNPLCQYWSGLPSTQLWINTTCGTSTFTMQASATDLVSSVSYVRFPALSSYAITATGGEPADDTTGPNPYEIQYTFGSTSQAVPSATITAVNGASLSSTTNVSIGRDVTGPASGTWSITNPGGTASPAWWSTQTTQSVTFSVGTDSGSGLRSYRIQRREASAPSCSTWGAWAELSGSTNAASPFASTSLVDGRCYQHRLVATDNVNNSSTWEDSTRLVRVDASGPTGGFNPVPAAVRGTLTLSGTAADGWSGLSSMTVKVGSTTLCTPTPAASWACGWNTTATPSGPVTLTLTLTDVAGNVTNVTANTIVDNTVPTGTVTLTEGTSPGAQHVVAGSPPRIYVNTAAGQSGTFTATVTVTEANSGMSYVLFPQLGQGWNTTSPITGAGPSYPQLHTWTGAANTVAPAAPGTQTITLQDAAGNVGSATYQVVADLSAPTSATIQYPGGPTTTPRITFSQGADSGSGIASWQLQRRAAGTIDPDTCNAATWGTWADVGAANPATSPQLDSTATNATCYQYRLIVTDNVGNSVTVADPEGDTVIIQPSEIIIVESAPDTRVVEGGATDTYTVRLRTRPAGDVTVTPTTGPAGQITTNPSSLTFTASDWNVPRTITVTAVDDSDDEVPDPTSATISHRATSSQDPAYASVLGTTIPVAVYDNDVSGFVLAPSPSLSPVHESGTTSTSYTLRLTSRPTANVVVDLAVAGAQVTISPARLTFTQADWSTPRTITVTAIDDDLDEATLHDDIIRHLVTSSDPLYAAQMIPDAVATIVDDETADVRVLPTSGLRIDETGPTSATYQVRLGSQPRSDVVITLVPDADSTVSSSTLVFTAANWNVLQNVVITAVDDQIAEGPHTTTISHLASSADPDYDLMAVEPTVANVTDNDTASVELAPSSGLTAAEGGGTSTYQVRLTSQPTADVTVAFNTGTELVPIAAITFTPANWGAYQTVMVVAVDDSVDEPVDPHVGTISHAVTSADPFYQARSVANQTVAITDNDTAGITLDELDGVRLDEANVAATDTVTIVLTSRPTADVRITPAPDGQLAAPGGTLIFTPTTWNVPQTMTIAVIDDAVDETDPHSGTVTFTVSSGDPIYAGRSITPVVAQIRDDDTAGLVISAAVPSVQEAGPTSDTYKVHLASRPTASVTVSITSDGQTTATASLTFTPATWNVDQTVTVTAVDDPDVELNPHTSLLTNSTTSSDPVYAALAPVVKQVTVVDDDIPGIEIDSLGGVAVTEASGISDTYEIRLRRRPTRNVTVTINPGSALTASPSTLTFTPATWNDAQTVTVDAIDNLIQQVSPRTATITHSIATTDPLWGAAVAPDQPVQITDNDIAAVIVSQAGPYALSENAPAPATTARYTVELATEPTAEVRITVTVPGDVASTATMLVFTPGDWNVPQSVDVGAIDDFVDETDPHRRSVVHTVASGDPFYAALTIAPVDLDIADNDVSSVIASRSSLAATEAGAGDTVALQLGSQPTAPVTVDLTGVQVDASPSTLLFTPANWNVPQTVAVAAIDDPIDEPTPHAGSVTFTVFSADPNYDSMAVAPIPVAVTDNDTSSVSIVPAPTPIGVQEAGTTTASYSMVLTSRPSANVTVSITTDSQVIVNLGSITFTPADWNSPRAVTVQAVDDQVDEVDVHRTLVTHATASGDPLYDGIAVPAQPVDVSDDDSSAVLITPATGIQLDEAAPLTTASVAVVLASRPRGDVTITLVNDDDQLTFAPSRLVFTPANWNVAQQVVVHVVDDPDDEPPVHLGVIRTSAASDIDPIYNVIDPADIVVDIADDDTAGVVVKQSGSPVSTRLIEGGATDTWTIVLTSRPVSSVRINIIGGLQATASPSSIRFTDTDWNVPQVITATAFDDFRVEGEHHQLFTHAIVTADLQYGLVHADDVDATITDNDVASVDVTPVTLSAGEGGGFTTYAVSLTAQPAADVNLQIAPDGQVDVNTTLLTFTPGNWSTRQYVSVTAFDDPNDEPSPHIGTIAHLPTSADPDFNLISVSDVTVSITDNDDPGVRLSRSTQTVSESGATDTYDMVVTTRPSSDVVVDLTEAGGQLEPLAPHTFTPANWNVPQTVTVRAIDDVVAEGQHVTRIEHATSSADGSYAAGAITVASVDVTISDNEVAGYVIAPVGDLAGGEGGTVRYAISLATQPVRDVVLTLTGDADVTPVATQLTFTSATWNIPQDIDVRIVDDAMAEGLHTGTVTSTVQTSDAMYGALPTPTKTVNIADDDIASVQLTPAPPGPLAVTEGGPGASYTIVLGSQPTRTVTIDLSSLRGEVATLPTTVTFHPATWNAPQTVTVVAVNDDRDEPSPQSDSVTHTANSSDPIYASIPVADMAVEVTDNDDPSVMVLPTGPDTSVAENGPTDTVSVKLTSRPSSMVTVWLTGVGVTLTPTTLTFLPGTWNVAQNVSVRAIDDSIAQGARLGGIDTVMSSSDPSYDGLAGTRHDVRIADDDVAGVIVTPPSQPTLDESDVARRVSYAVRLRSQPTSDVVISVTPDAQVDAGVAALTFTPASWNINQQVSVGVVDDSRSEPSPHPGVVTHAAASSDPAYDAGELTIASVTLQITDDDAPGITVAPVSGHRVGEGGATSSYTIVLDSEPRGEVTITPLSTQLAWTIPSVTFTPADWSVPVTVTLAAVDDDVDEPDLHAGALTHVVVSSDDEYAGITTSLVNADIADNDTSDLVLDPVGPLMVDEAGTIPPQRYHLTLTSRPEAPVIVNLGWPQGTLQQVITSVGVVTLDASNWQTGVEVDVVGYDDKVDEAAVHRGFVTHAMTSADLDFNGETGPQLPVDIVDDDEARVEIRQTDGSTNVSENGAVRDEYEVVLTAQPLADVTIAVSGDGQVDASPGSLLFTPANWDQPQLVTVSAIDDHRREDSIHAGVVSHAITTTDTAYGALGPVEDVLVNVIDDDLPAIVIEPDGGSLEVTEGGSGDRVVVRLDTEPAAPVVIDLSTGTQAAVAPSRVTLDASNWSTGVSVVVSAVNDPRIEGQHSDAITWGVASGDPDYDQMIIPLQTILINDDDTAGIVIDVDDGVALDEARTATTDRVTVRLAAQPSAGTTVTVSLAYDALQLGLDTTRLTFDDATWDTPQTVTFEVVDDPVDEDDPHVSSVAVAATSDDVDFDGVTAPAIDARIADDDTSAIVFSPAGPVSVSEESATSQTVDVRLATRPAGQVTLTWADDGQITAAGDGAATSLTFDASSWDQPQQLTITAVDDRDDEPDVHPGVLTVRSSSPDTADPRYAALADVSYGADVTDNDVSELVIDVVDPGPVSEGDTQQVEAWDVRLTSRPTAEVRITIVPDAQVVVEPEILRFDATNWDTPQRAVIRAVNDAVDEQDVHPGIVAFDVTSADASYEALVPVPRTIDVLDDDVAGVTIIQAPRPGLLDEQGSRGAATYDVLLDSEPTADVTITLSADAQLRLDGSATLTFTPANWSVPQPVTVHAVDDMYVEDETHVGAVSHATDSPDPNYGVTHAFAVADAVFDITDNDVHGFTMTPVAPALEVAEEGETTATYDLAIRSIPPGDVTVTFDAPGDDITVSPASHTFTAANAATPVTITVTAIDDIRVEGTPHAATVTQTVAPGSDSAYLALDPSALPAVPVGVADNDVASVVVDTLDGVSVDEAGTRTDTFTVRLGARPLKPVTLTFDSAGQLADLADQSVTIDPADWDTPRVVTVRGFDDSISELSPHVVPLTIVTTSDQVLYDRITTPKVDVSIDDNDPPFFLVVEPDDHSMDEADPTGSERLVGVRLSRRPTGSVKIMARSNGQVMLLEYATLTFTPANWDVVRSFRIQPAPDPYAEAPIHRGAVTLRVSESLDPEYTTAPERTVDFDIADDDYMNAKVVCMPGAQWPMGDDGRLKMAEDPALPEHVAVCHIQLGTPVSQDVTIRISSSPVGQVAADVDTVTIPADQTMSGPITLVAVDDMRAEARPHPATITFDVQSADPIYDVLDPAPLEVDIADNDVAGFEIDPTGAVLLEEGGASVTGSIRLTSEPLSDVVISLADIGIQATAKPAALTFTPENWNIAQQFTLEAVDDPFDEPDVHPERLRYSITTGDAMYAALTLEPLDITIKDNDTIGVQFEMSDGGNAVAEGGAKDTMSIRLGTLPKEIVTVQLSAPSGQLTLTPATFTFTPSNWNVPRQVTIGAAQDDIVEGLHIANIEYLVDSADPDYKIAQKPLEASYDVKITDDEEPSLAIMETETTRVSEAGDTDTYTITLSGRPTGSVMVGVAPNSQAAVVPSQLTFTRENWNIPQTVLVTAVQDSLDEDDVHVTTIQHTLVTDAPGWGNALIRPVKVFIADDDTAHITIGSEGEPLVVSEGSATGETIPVSLSSQPKATVSIAVRGLPQLKTPALALRFTPDDWDRPATIDVTAIDDDLIEGDHEGTLTFAITTTDSSYRTMSITPIAVQIHDNDDEGTGPIDTDPNDRDPRGTDPGTDGGNEVPIKKERTRVRRSGSGSDRTESGKKRTESGLGTASPLGSGSKKQSGRKLDSLVTAAQEEQVAKKKKPSVFSRVIDWLKERWRVWAPLVALSAVAAGAALYMVRADPVKAAQRGAAAKLAAESASSKQPLPKRGWWRLFGKRRKKRDEEDEESPRRRSDRDRDELDEDS